MSRYALACSIVAALLPSTATADVGTPGFHRIPHDFVIESDVPSYRFWLVSRRGLEPLPLAPGRPVVVNGSKSPGRWLLVGGSASVAGEQTALSAVTAPG